MTAIVLAFLLAVLAAAPPPEVRSAPLFARTEYLSNVLDSGETLTYSLSWLRVVGGHAVITMSPVSGTGGRRIRIHSIAQSNAFFSTFFRVRDEIESVVDASDFGTVIFQKILREGRHNKQELTVIDRSRNVATRKGEEIPVPPMVLDPLSTIVYIRFLALAPGSKTTLTVIADGKVYPIEASVTGRETIRVPAGTFKTVVVEPKMRVGGIFRDENTRLVVWYTDDERRIPVRIRSEIPAGSITASLEQSAPASLPPAR